ncbi:MAG: PhzF family phenazine biosynthesis protein [Candidatus Heimdallarchaeota archaeon]|nr:PhzF family phenazine biosynthesis protein [Candidatus Heimdallarchaeota archaeon]
MEQNHELIPLYQIDAFTDQTFKGNPAAVCILSKDYDDFTLQKIAAEMNLSETAFVRVQDKSSVAQENIFPLRWFTPQVEVNLCGHATLATAAVMFYEMGIESDEVFFDTLSGRLSAKKVEGGIALNFPKNESEQIQAPDELLDALGITKYVSAAYAEGVTDILIEVETEMEVKYLKPDFSRMTRLSLDRDIRGVMVTAKGTNEQDFVSRFFAPWVGINEDPVTGSAHTILTPYWSKRLHKNEMTASQISARGGHLKVKLLENERVEIIGQTKLVLKGELYL